MWTHYSENHEGFCVGLDCDMVFESLPSCRAAPIIYSPTYPQIDPLGERMQTAFEHSHTKDYNWKYEKEYRYFSNLFILGKGNNSRIIVLDRKCFKEIIIGLRFPVGDIEKISRYAKKLEVPIYKIIKSNDSFKLKREPI